MKYCRHCGKEVADETIICLNCGCKTNGYEYKSATVTSTNNIPKNNNEPSTATWSKICGIVSFFCGWIVGIAAIILANTSKKDTNGVMCQSAKVGYICGIVSTTIHIIITFVFLIFMSNLASFMADSASFMADLASFTSDLTSFMESIM